MSIMQYERHGCFPALRSIREPKCLIIRPSDAGFARSAQAKIMVLIKSNLSRINKSPTDAPADNRLYYAISNIEFTTFVGTVDNPSAVTESLLKKCSRLQYEKLSTHFQSKFVNRFL